jgi:hypothetical protein
MLYHLKSKLNSQNDKTGHFNRLSVLLLVSGLFCFGYFYFYGGEKLKEERLEQLRKVFKKILFDLINSVDARHGYKDIRLNRIMANEYADDLVLEVKIRINNKEGGE